jgi:hypothetical protein
MKSLLWFIALPFLMAGNAGVDLSVERMYIGFQAVPNSTTECKLVLNLRVANQGDIQSPSCELKLFASPVRESKTYPVRDSIDIRALEPGESLDIKHEWRVDKGQADQLCKEECCGIMLVKAWLEQNDTLKDINPRNDEIVSVLIGKKPVNYAEINSLDSVFVKMKPEDMEEILGELNQYNSMILKMINAGNSGCWLNQENGYASIVYLNR